MIATRIAEFVVWISLAALFYVYLGYPLLLGVVAFCTRRPRAALGYLPNISILIAAYNEEAGIEKKLEQTLALNYPRDKMEIIVLSDGSTDRTEGIVKTLADQGVRLLRVPDRKGKTNAQNFGARAARGEILIFSDATTVYHPMALQYLVCNFADPRIGAVSGRYQYFDPNGDSATGLGTIAFWNFENLIKTMQSRIRTISGCCGCIYAVRSSVYTALAPDVISDLVQPLWAIRKGYYVTFEDRALAYEETTRSAGQEFSMRVRVVTRGIRGLLSVPDLLNPLKHGWVSFQLWSHKVLRWAVPFFLLFLLAGNAALWDQPGYQLLLLLQLAFYAFVLLTLFLPLHRIWKPIGIPLYFCTLNAAAFCSVVEIVRGRKYIVWETVRN